MESLRSLPGVGRFFASSKPAENNFPADVVKSLKSQADSFSKDLAGNFVEDLTDRLTGFLNKTGDIACSNPDLATILSRRVTAKEASLDKMSIGAAVAMALATVAFAKGVVPVVSLAIASKILLGFSATTIATGVSALATLATTVNAYIQNKDILKARSDKAEAITFMAEANALNRLEKASTTSVFSTDFDADGYSGPSQDDVIQGYNTSLANVKGHYTALEGRLPQLANALPKKV